MREQQLEEQLATVESSLRALQFMLQNWAAKYSDPRLAIQEALEATDAILAEAQAR